MTWYPNTAILALLVLLQLVPAMVGLFAYKAAALVQVYRDNEDLQLIFPENEWQTILKSLSPGIKTWSLSFQVGKIPIRLSPHKVQLEPPFQVYPCQNQYIEVTSEMHFYFSLPVLKSSVWFILWTNLKPFFLPVSVISPSTFSLLVNCLENSATY